MGYSGLWFISSHGYLDLMFWDLFFHTKTPEMGGWVLPKAKCFFLAKKDDFNRGCFWSLSFGWNYIDLYVKDCEFELMSDGAKRLFSLRQHWCFCFVYTYIVWKYFLHFFFGSPRADSYQSFPQNVSHRNVPSQLGVSLCRLNTRILIWIF